MGFYYLIKPSKATGLEFTLTLPWTRDGFLDPLGRFRYHARFKKNPANSQELDIKHE